MMLSEALSGEEPVELERDAEYGRSVGENVFVSDSDLKDLLNVDPATVTDDELVYVATEVITRFAEMYEEVLKDSFEAMLKTRGEVVTAALAKFVRMREKIKKGD
jgi:hypothetical protein